MNSARETLSLNIDNKTVQAEKGSTILQAAEKNNIYIPTLCAHKQLAPFGACRMCIVEVDGIRGLPTACTTPVQQGMVVRTRTDQVDALRLEVLQLILSEHTSSCLICDEKDECRKVLNTIRKAGVTTGCRYCPSDNQCELQDVVERLGVKQIDFPITYRNLRVEKEDPFFDRDYNLCILCGRCVRVCQDVRGVATLAFGQRGRDTVIGPAFHRTHMDSGCEFCGDCVEVCPTGAMSEKANKWDGKADREEVTTCALCGVGCQIRILVKGRSVIGSLPAEDHLISDEQLCLKGRFCITELVNNHQRLVKPFKKYNGGKAEISWDEAINTAAERLAACPPNEFGMAISPDCCNEDLYVAQKFARSAMGSHHIDSTARRFYGAAFNAYVNLIKKGVPLSDLGRASVILCLGLDTRFSRSVVGVELRKAVKKGAKLITVNSRPHNLSLISSHWIQPAPGAELDLFRSLVAMTAPGSAEKCADSEVSSLADMLLGATAPIILMGPEFLHLDDSAAILEEIGKLAENTGAGIVSLPGQGNLVGTLLMGTYPEVLPGGYSSSEHSKIEGLSLNWGRKIPEFTPSWNTSTLSSAMDLKLLYLIGAVPSDLDSVSEFSIYQNIYPPETLSGVDLLLPAAAFTEVEGTFINGEGRIQAVRKATEPPGEALPDWQILCRIARKMGVGGFDFQDISEIRREIASLVPQFREFDPLLRKAYPPVCEGRIVAPAVTAKAGKASALDPLVLSTSVAEHSYRGFPLSTLVEGSRKVFAERILYMNSKDAAGAGISQGDEVVVSSDDFERIWPVRILGDQPEGVLNIVLRQSEVINPNPHPVRIRKKDV